MKRVIAVLAFAALFLTSCASYKDIKVTSVEVVSLSPNGLKEVDALIRVGIDNPIISFAVKDVEGILRDGDTPVAYFITDQLTVDGKTTKVYDIPVKGRLSEDSNIMKLLEIATRRDFSSLKADVQARVSLRNGIGKTININDIPIAK